MGLLVFELKQEHLMLLKAINWSVNNIKATVGAEDEYEAEYTGPSPFGGDNIYEDMDTILNGIPPEPFDPFNAEPRTFTEEQTAAYDKLLKDLSLALDIILKTQKFELGTYTCRYHDRVWSKMASK